MGLLHAAGSFLINMIVSGVVAVFDAIGKAMAGMFTAELSLVWKFVSNDNVLLGGSFKNLLEFNAVVIPGLAMLVFLVWLAAKGMTGGNSKTSTEEMLKRIIGASVVSFALGLLVSPVEKLIGALDDALFQVANVNSQGLTHTFAGIFTVSALTGIEDSIFITLLILFIGLILVGILILILIVAHAAVFLMVYFAPYLTLFRKDGFREAVEVVVAALSMPFIITSVLAVGIAAMGATGTVQPAALESGATTLSAMIGHHLVHYPISLAKNSTVSPVQYFSNAFGGILILVSAIIFPRFIIAGIFQAGAAFHDAFHGAAKQPASGGLKALSPGGDESSRLSRGLRKFTGNGSALSGGGPQVPAGGNSGSRGSPSPIVNRSQLADDAMRTTKITGAVEKTGAIDNAASFINSSPASSANQVPTGAKASANSHEYGLWADAATAKAANGDPSNPADAATEQIPLVDGSEKGLEGTGTNSPEAVVGYPDDPPPNELPSTGSDEANTKLRHLTPKEWVGTHYKGTLKAIPEALQNMKIQPENPLQMGIEARTAWRMAKRKNIHQLRDPLRSSPKPAKESQPSKPAKNQPDGDSGGGDSGSSKEAPTSNPSYDGDS